MTQKDQTENPTGGDSLLIITAACIPLLGGGVIAHSIGLDLIGSLLLVIGGGGLASVALPDATRASIYVARYAYYDLHPMRSTAELSRA